MTDAHDRLKAERDQVLRSLSGLAWANASTALDALIEKAIALGAEPLVAALRLTLAELVAIDALVGLGDRVHNPMAPGQVAIATARAALHEAEATG